MTKPILVVTGGSRGIGRAVSLGAAARGYAVCFSYFGNEAAARETVALIEAEGGTARAVQGDCGVPGDIDRLFDAADAMGRLAGLVNNAGIIAKAARIDEVDAERLEKLLRTNVSGSVLCAKAAILRMSMRHGGKGGAIVNLSSASSRIGGAGASVDYAMTKGAIDTFTLGLARELADEGIRVNAVSPGMIDTEIHDSIGPADRLERALSSIPMKRAGTAEEVAAAILWLLSDEASYVTGTILDVAGGR